jgi:hypothetical protein
MDCWQQQIRGANTEADVVRMAADYLTLWAPRELAPIHLGWRDFTIASAADVERVKRWLIESVNSAQVAPNASELRELASYFWHAAVRIGEIRGAQRVLH